MIDFRNGSKEAKNAKNLSTSFFQKSAAGSTLWVLKIDNGLSEESWRGSTLGELRGKKIVSLV